MTTRAPDGKPWVKVHVGVAKNEQRPWCFGYYAAADLDDRTICHSGRLDPDSPCADPRIGGAFVSTRTTLDTGDYTLLGQDGAPLDVVCVERKEADLASSLTWGHDRLEAEFVRMARFQRRALVYSCTLQDVIRGKASSPRTTVQSMVGSLLALSTRYNVPTFGLPDRWHAEYFAAWVLRDAWRAALVADPRLLAALRLEEARDAAHARPEPKALPSPPMRNRSGTSAPPPPVEGLQPDPRASPRIRHVNPNPAAHTTTRGGYTRGAPSR